MREHIPLSVRNTLIGYVICPKQRPATATEVWVELASWAVVALGDLLVIGSPRQTLIGMVVDMEMVEESAGTPSFSQRLRHPRRTTLSKVAILSASDQQQRPPEGSTVRRAQPAEVTTLLAEARWIPLENRVPLAVIPLPDGFAPVFAHLGRIAGPIATSALITGAAGSLKSTAGVLLVAGVLHVVQSKAAVVLVNSKGNDFLFADHAREVWSKQGGIRPLRERDLAIYEAMAYQQPPVLRNVTVFVPKADDRSWRSARPFDYPHTRPYNLSYNAAVRYACSPTEDEEQATSIVTRQCIEEVAGPFAEELRLTNLRQIVEAVEAEFLTLRSERSRWRSQFQATTLAAALRQLCAAERDLGPLLGDQNDQVAFRPEELANGGVWIVDIATLPHKAAQAVLDELISDLLDAKTCGIIPPELPLILLVDELNRWTTNGPTASRLAGIVRDQRHRRFSLVGLAQQLSTLHPQLLANVDTFWIGTTRSQELSSDSYNHLPSHIRTQIHRLGVGQRVLDTWPLAQPLIAEIPFPSWLNADEGLVVVEEWQKQQ